MHVIFSLKLRCLKGLVLDVETSVHCDNALQALATIAQVGVCPQCVIHLLLLLCTAKLYLKALLTAVKFVQYSVDADAVQPVCTCISNACH